jgi:hypothetical protein
MKKIAAEKALPVIKVVEYLEKIINRRRLDKAYHRDEVEKHFTYLMQGKNMIDPYERRDAGISDDEWEKVVQEMYKFLGLTGDKKADEKNIFD